MGKDLNTIKQFEYTDILGWSVSRYDKFCACRRQYYYDYYGRYDTEYPRSRIQALKQMTSVALETGNVVHDVIKVLLERLLRSEAPVDTARFLDFARRKTDEYCAAKSFSEVHYGELPRVEPARVFEGVEKSLGNFLSSDRFRWIVREAVANKSGWVIEPPGYGETRINGYKAYCKVDFLFPVDDGLHILDWKTGRADAKKHRKQMLGYATWASYHFDRNADRITPTVAYLQPVYSELPVALNEFDLHEFIGLVEKETKEMYAYCAQVPQNVPKPKGEFEKTANRIVCKYCNYRELCA